MTKLTIKLAVAAALVVGCGATNTTFADTTPKNGATQGLRNGQVNGQKNGRKEGRKSGRRSGCDDARRLHAFSIVGGMDGAGFSMGGGLLLSLNNNPRFAMPGGGRPSCLEVGGFHAPGGSGASG